jgi:hypothetical protein
MLDALDAALIQKPPFCSGAIALSSTDGHLFYQQEKDSARYVNRTLKEYFVR